jgi:dCMP deaminase
MRPTTTEYFSKMARLVSTRGTCFRRKVGCVLVDSRNFVLATGYNGRPSGFDHCEGDTKCEGACSKSGTNLDACEAIHAEQNALLQCSDSQRIYAAYVTAFPCITCIKLLLNTSCKLIVYDEDYPHQQSKDLWAKSGREAYKYGDSVK